MPLTIDKPWSIDADAVATGLAVDVVTGLDEAEATRRRSVAGANRLRESPAVAWWSILARQFKSLVVALLGAAALVSFFFGEGVEGAAIVAVLVINAGLGFAAELRAVRSMEALRLLGSEKTRIRREGEEHLIGAALVVPGDVILFEGGDRISADLRLVEAAQLEADESVLTGESLPVPKDGAAVAAATELHARTNMLFKGTTVTRGAGVGIVVATGMATEIGRIAELVEGATEEVTPLEERLDELGRRLVGLTVLVAGAVCVIGIVSGKELFLMVQTGIALAVAAIPEGLPIVATIALARGMWRMANRNALIKRLSAVETLGATTLILTDKTGTLTENRLTARRLVTQAGAVSLGAPQAGAGAVSLGAPQAGAAAISLGTPHAGAGADSSLPARALRIAALCSDASISGSSGGWEGVGDPLEIALLVAAAEAGILRSALLEASPEEREEAFDSTTKMMATFHRASEGFEVAVKGAAEAVIAVSDHVLSPAGSQPLGAEERAQWERVETELAGQGFRVLGLATKHCAAVDEAPYRNLTFVGLVALLDPPRENAGAALDACRAAGIRVVMVTGDQAATAAYIAKAVRLTAKDARVTLGRDLPDVASLSRERREELLDTAIFARVDPEQKLGLIALHQDAGEVVAMTGDGVNDAPALRKADIGIAMGQRGTQVAQEASDMVLTDDSFGSIVAAVQQGRVIFGNIRKFVVYLMSCNMSEVFIVAGAVVLNAPLPILPLQILFLNLVTDVFPALALALGEGDPDLMRRSPRDPQEPILTRRHWIRIVGFAATITVAVLAALALAISVLDLDTRGAVTVSFATLAISQLWHVFNLRDQGSTVMNNDVVRNPWVWGAVALCLGLVAAAVHLPGLSGVLRTSNPGLAGWGVILGMSLLPWAAGQLWASRGASVVRTP